MEVPKVFTIRRIDKRAFEKAFEAGERVAVVKDPNYWKFYDNSIGSTHEVDGPVGFTRETVTLEDIYRDSPSRPGEAFRFFVIEPDTTKGVLDV